MKPVMPAASEDPSRHANSPAMLLEEVWRRAAEQLGRATARALQTVAGELDALDRACAPGDARRYDLGLANAWRDPRVALEVRLGERLDEAFRSFVKGTSQRPRPFSETQGSWTELSLMADGDLEESVRLSDMAGRLRHGADEELAALDQRMAALLSMPCPRPEDNPLGPEAICDALRASLGLLQGDRTLRLLLIAAFHRVLSETLLPLYQDLNALLRQHGVLPAIRYGETRKPVSSSAPAMKRRGTDGSTAAGDGSLAALLRQVVMAMDVRPAQPPAEGGAPAPAPAPSADHDSLPADQTSQPATVPAATAPAPSHTPSPDLLQLLDCIERGDFSTTEEDVIEALRCAWDSPPAKLSQAAGLQAGQPAPGDQAQSGPVNALRKLRETGLAARMDPMDTLTLDMVALLFEQLFGDARITPPMKALIGRLQIPMLKVALLDRTFFSNRDHPARRALDLVGEISRGLDRSHQAFSGLSRRIEAVVDRAAREFTGNMGVFERTAAELHSLWRNAQVAARRQAQRVQELERLDTARQHARDTLRARVAGHSVPRTVLHFLATEWLKLMVITYATSGADSRAWQSVLETLDNLLWTLTPKESLRERRRLVSLLPPLLKALHKGMAAIGTTEPVKERFVAALTRCHAHAIAASMPETSAALPPQPPAAATPASRLPPRTLAAAPATPATTATTPAPTVTTPSPTVTTPVPTATQDAPRALPAVEEPRRAGFAEQNTLPTALPAAQANLPPPAAAAVEEAQAAGALPTPAARAKTVLPAPGPAKPAATPQDEPVAAPVAAEAPALTVRNPFGDGEIELEEVFFGEAATPMPLPATDRHAQTVAKLREGDWVEIHGQAGAAPMQARLCRVDTQRGSYEFTNRKGQRIAAYSLFQLTAEVRGGRIVPVDAAPSPGRGVGALAGLLRKGNERPA